MGMESKYVAMIVIGGLFLFWLLLYIGCFIEVTNDRIHREKAMHIYYSSKGLAKMEYDVAFPESEASIGRLDDEQVTMDEVINEEKHVAEFNIPIFNVGEFEGSKEIVGKYNPDVDD